MYLINGNRDKVIYRSEFGFALMHRKRRIKTSQFNVTKQRFLSQRYFRLGCPGSSTGK